MNSKQSTLSRVLEFVNAIKESLHKKTFTIEESTAYYTSYLWLTQWDKSNDDLKFDDFVTHAMNIANGLNKGYSTGAYSNHQEGASGSLAIQMLTQLIDSEKPTDESSEVPVTSELDIPSVTDEE